MKLPAALAAAVVLALIVLGSVTRAMDAALIHTPELEEDL